MTTYIGRPDGYLSESTTYIGSYPGSYSGTTYIGSYPDGYSGNLLKDRGSPTVTAHSSAYIVLSP